MSFTARKKAVKFCPFCGSRYISHIKNGIFFCGPLNPTEEIVKKIYSEGDALCGRLFRAVYDVDASHKELKKRFNDIQQELFRKGEITAPPRRGEGMVQ